MGENAVVYGGLAYFDVSEESRREKLVAAHTAVTKDALTEDNLVVHMATARPPFPPFNGKLTSVIVVGWFGEDKTWLTPRTRSRPCSSQCWIWCRRLTSWAPSPTRWYVAGAPVKLANLTLLTWCFAFFL